MWLVLYRIVLIGIVVRYAIATKDLCNLSAGQIRAPWLADDSGRLWFPVYNQEAIITAADGFPNNEATEQCEIDNTGNAFCGGRLNATFLSAIKTQILETFVVYDYNVEIFEKKYVGALRQNKVVDRSAGFQLSEQTYKATGDVYSAAVGIGMTVSLDLAPNTNYDGFVITGNAFSNELRVGWQIEGQLRILDNNQAVVIQAEVATVGKGGWSFIGTSILKDQTGMWRWAMNGTLNCDLLLAPITFNGELITSLVKGQTGSWKLAGNVNVRPLLIEWQVDATVTSTHNEKITIPQDAFDGINIKNLLFKNSYFMGDFDKDALQGINSLETITFINSKLEEMPRLDFLFNGLDNLKAIYIEESTMPNINMGNSPTLTSLELLSFKGSGPIQFHESSASWLEGSNLTYLNLQDCNINIVNSLEAQGGGVLQPIASTLRYLDLSYTSLSEEAALESLLQGLEISHLSLAGLQLNKVPFNALLQINNTLRFLTLRENKFRKVPEENMFSVVLNFPAMPQLEELDLTHCDINYIETGVFDNLTGLKKLFLGRNNVENVQEGWYSMKPELHLIDLSWNGQVAEAAALNIQSGGGFTNFTQLQVADFSNAAFSHSDDLLESLSKTTQELFVCNNNLKSSAVHSIHLPSLTMLDISGNPDIEFSSLGIIQMLNSMQSLKYFYTRNNRITNTFFTALNDFVTSLNANNFIESLEVLDLSGNNLKTLVTNLFLLFPRLKYVDLTSNSIAAWTSPLSFNPQLRTLLISDNKIETITSAMLTDLVKLDRSELGRNPFICECNILKFLNQMSSTGDVCPSSTKYFPQQPRFLGTFVMRKSKASNCEQRKSQKLVQHCVNLTDWANGTDYYCYLSGSDKITGILEIRNDTDLCMEAESSSLKEATTNFDALYVGIGVLITLCAIGAFIYWKWWEIRMMTRAVRNAAILSFMEKDGAEATGIQYDAFVSYCEKDRPWVVQHMLPHLDQWTDISVCLHERDFQVGVSILDNITSSMDRSRHLVLVLSQSFIKSQWCQFELQLAQQRLIECKRDRLILILLEPIPAYKKPKTLRYLMRTNTYIEWPGDTNATSVQRFWDRLQGSIK